VIEQRMLEPLLHRHKLALSALCFAVRTGNTFLGSLLWVIYSMEKLNFDIHSEFFMRLLTGWTFCLRRWVDYAKFIGIQ
jgi:hypothetical protein